MKLEPIGVSSPASLAYAVPVAAAADLLEWSSTPDLPAYVELLLSKPLSPEQMLNSDSSIRVTDDRPFNEYFLLRRWRF